MKNLTLAVVALIVLGFASLGFTLIKNQSPKSEIKETLISKDKMMMDMSKTEKQKAEGKELASFD